jgi:hypothetical protein
MILIIKQKIERRQWRREKRKKNSCLTIDRTKYDVTHNQSDDGTRKNDVKVFLKVTMHAQFEKSFVAVLARESSRV